MERQLWEQAKCILSEYCANGAYQLMENVLINFDLKMINDFCKETGAEYFIHQAVRHNRINIVQLLLKYGADIGMKNAWGETPLHIACRDGLVEMSELLIDRGADMYARDYKHQAPLAHALQFYRLDVVRLFLRKEIALTAHSVFSPYSGRTILEDFYDSTNFSVFDSLDLLNIKYQGGVSLLHIASEVGAVEIIKHLLKSGLDVNMTSELKLTSLHFAASNGKTDAANILVQFGANVDARDSYGSTALLVAAKNGHAETVEVLSKLRANVNAQDAAGNTALHNCVHEDVVKVLLMRGTDVGIRNFNNQTVLESLDKETRRLSGECLAELLLMKSIFIDNYSTMYDVFFSGKDDLILNGSREVLEEMFAGVGGFSSKFPIYGNYLNREYTVRFKPKEAIMDLQWFSLDVNGNELMQEKKEFGYSDSMSLVDEYIEADSQQYVVTSESHKLLAL